MDTALEMSFLSDTLESISEAITVHDAEHNIIYANRAAHILLGEGFRIGQKCYKAFHGLDSLASYCPSCQCWESLSQTSFKRYEQHLNRLLEVSTLPQLDAQGNMSALIHITRDISVIEQDKRVARQRERKLTRLIEQTEAIYWSMDVKTGAFTYVSPQAERLTGYPPSKWTDMAFWASIVHPDDRQWATEYCLGETAICRDHSFIYRMITRDGRTLWINDIVNVVNDGSGLIELQGIMIDITRDKENERRLMQYKTVVNASRDFLAVVDLDFRYRIVNDSYVEAAGLLRHEILGTKVEDFIGLDLFESTVKPRMMECLQGREVNYEVWAEFPRTGRRCLDVALYPYRDDTGDINGIVIRSRDITAIKQSEERLRSALREARDEKAKSEAIIQAMGDGVAIVDPGFRVLFQNTAHRQIMGNSIGRTCYSAYHGRDSICPGCPIKVAISENRIHTAERAVSLHGQQKYVEVTASPLWDSDGKIVAAIELTHDVTERRNTEHMLEQALIDLDAAKKNKEEFFARMSHEIRTPMNGIIGLTEVLLGKELDSESREIMDRVYSSADSLLCIVNDLLDFSKLEAGKTILAKEPFVIMEALKDSLYMFAFNASSRGIKLKTEFHGQARSSVVTGDALRLKQVIVNLIGNALKFTSAGSVGLDVRMVPAENGMADVSFSVSDTGIGIAAEHIDSIFESFSQADAATFSKFGGTGLGLAISSHLVKLMGGSLGVVSAPGKGSTFSFTIRMPYRADSSSSLRILLVEDNPINQKVAARMLEKGGHRVDLAHSGAAAVLATKANAYDLVLMDLMMPGELDGFEAAKAIKAINALLPIVALTAMDPAEASQRCREAGMASMVTKPLSSRELLAAVENARASKT